MTTSPRARLPLWICGGLALAVLAVYGQVAAFDFVRYDDPAYVTDNPHVREGLTAEGLRWAFTTTLTGNWHPLTWISLMLDAELGGGASVFHLTSVGLHLVNSLLLFYLLLRATGLVWGAGFVAAMFALHPLHVESVAWIAERKDVLSGLFFLLTLLAWLRYVERPVARRYVVVAFCFALGLMAKPMLVTLPLLLLLLDYWPLGRKGPWRLIREKVPLFALSAASSIVTLYAQGAVGAVAAVESFPPWARAANAAVSYVRYLSKTFWPSGLALPYPYDLELLTPVRVTLALILLAAISLLALRWARSRPYLAVGWCWYVITLLPVIGLVQVGSQSMADRYTYIPLIGVFVVVAWGAADLVGSRVLVAILAGAATLATATVAYRQVGHWRDTTTLSSHALAVTQRNAVAHELLGLELLDAGSLEPAVLHLSEAVRIAPDFIDARANLAAALARQGRHDQALDLRREVLERRPGDPDALAHLGLALDRTGRQEEALARLSEALRLEPDNTVALKGLAAALVRKGRGAEAAAHLRTAVDADPEDAEARANLGTVLLRQGRLDEAEVELTAALRVDPDNISAHKNLGVLLARQERLDEAIAHFSEALRIDPADQGARRNLERARSLLEKKKGGSSPPF